MCLAEKSVASDMYKEGTNPDDWIHVEMAPAYTYASWWMFD